MALPRADQVWIPDQPQHCQEMRICMNETLNPQLLQKVRSCSCPHCVLGFPFLLILHHTRCPDRGQQDQTQSLAKLKMWVCSFLDSQPVKESIRTEWSEEAGVRRCVHAGSPLIPPPPFSFFHAGNNKVLEPRQS